MKNFGKYVLVILLIFMSIPFFGGCKEQYTSGLEFTLMEEGSAYAVSKGTANTVGKVVIPSKYDGKPVTMIGHNAFKDCYEMTSIIMPTSVTRIGQGAFGKCTGLTSVAIPEGVKIIDYTAFVDCVNLTDISISSTVTNIGDSAFVGCDKISNISVSAQSATYKSEGNCLVYLPDSTVVWTYLDSVIPSYVTGVGDYAILGCGALSKITISDQNTALQKVGGKYLINTVDATLLRGCGGDVSLDHYYISEIGNNAFYGCDLTSIVLPTTVVSIERNAFENCERLESIIIPAGVTWIGSYAFIFCDSLTIYMEGEIPAATDGTWSAIWNIGNCPVVMGCTLSADKAYVVSFIKSQTSIQKASPLGSITAPYRVGYTFKEWNTAADGTGTAYAATDVQIASNGTTLFAIWAQESL